MRAKRAQNFGVTVVRGISYAGGVEMGCADDNLDAVGREPLQDW
jgi:hypothetical protein